MTHNKSDIFFDLVGSKNADIIEDMVKEFKKNNKLELEFSFISLNYSNYIRIVEHYVNVISVENTSTINSLDISIILEDGNTYRITLLDEDAINTFIATYRNANSSQILKYLSTLGPSDNIEIMLKNRGSAKRIFIENLDMVVKNTEEITTGSKDKITFAGSEKILYRYKERVSFNLGKVQLDITDVKESKILGKLSGTSSKYEIEIEVTDRKIKTNELYTYVINVLSIVQNADIPMGKEEARTVIESYQNLLNIKRASHLDSRNVISLEVHHLINFIPNRYGITDKADGDRYFLFVVSKNVYLLSTNLVIKKTNMVIEDKKYQNLLLDGELIENDQGRMYLAFDVIYANDVDYRFNNSYILPARINILNNIMKDVFHFIPFVDYASNHTDLELSKIREFYSKELRKYWNTFKKMAGDNSGEIFVTRKLYFVPYGIDFSEVFMYADLVWKSYVYDKLTPYSLDGIIYTPISTPYLIKATPDEYDTVPLEYKWKKPSLNSIDFFIRFEKDDNGNDAIFYDNAVKQDSGNAYKICHLHVGLIRGSEEKPVPFKVKGQEQIANLYLVDGEARDLEGNIIEDNTVVEFIFDNFKIDMSNAYKWLPLKTRYDKTESVIKYGKRYGNNINIANRVWRSIINPITEENIATLADPDLYRKEIERLSKINIYNKQTTVYYQKKTSNGAGMRAFHNWIKTNLITTYCENVPSVLDIGCGRGGDLNKFIHAGVQEYVGIDVDNNGLYVINDSAYKRYQSFKQSMKNIPPMYFINADARGLLNLKSQESIFPKMSDNNRELIKKFFHKGNKFTVFNSQFSLHYMLSDDLSWSNFCTNLNNYLDDNGYFLITCFDGNLIREKLKNKSNLTVSYTDRFGNKDIFFEIRKVYNDTDKNGTGLAIDVYNSLISNPGTYIREYLVMPDFLQKSLEKNCGLELVESDSFIDLFNLYNDFFTKPQIAEMSEIDINKKQYDNIQELYLMLNPANRDHYGVDKIEASLASFKFSMLNRYYVFKKVRQIDFTEASRIHGINYQMNVGKVLTPYFAHHHIIIDPTRKTQDLNKIYHAIRKANKKIKPDVYLIRHNIQENSLDQENEIFRHNKFDFVKIKEGSTPQTLLLYKSPDKYFYPVYQKIPKGNRYLFNNEGASITNELDILVELTNQINN